MTPSGEAVATASADHMPFAAHDFAGMEIDDVRADLDDFADEFVSDHQRHRDGGAGPVVPFVNVEVSAADTGEQDPNQDIVDSDLRFGRFFEPETAFRPAFDESSSCCKWRYFRQGRPDTSALSW